MIAWREAMSVGAPALDADHKKLIDLINLAEQFIGLESWPKVQTLIGQLIEYSKFHFSREEAVMASLKFPDFDDHKKSHESISKKLLFLNEKFGAAQTEADRRTCASVLIKVTQEWLIDHVLKTDMKYKSYIPRKAPPVAGPPPEPMVLTGMPVLTDDEVAAERRAKREAREKDIEYALPDSLAHFLKRMDYVVPELGEPAKSFESFDKFCVAALCRRVDKVLVFFQRHNPALKLELPPFFLASPVFAKKFHQAIEHFVFPFMWESRQLRNLATSFNWAEEDTDSFWAHVTRPLELAILQAWIAAWDELKLVESSKGGQRVLQVKETTKVLRELLMPPDPEEYDIPKIGNREIEVFKSLLDPANDWSELLERSWRKCNDLYEQEKDPRVFQQKAREGAFRDGLLDTFTRFPPEWMDFVVLTCHRVFPRVTTTFLEAFATNLGRSEAERERHIPYTIRYLNQARQIPAIRVRERQDEAEWEAKMLELRDFLANRPHKD